MIGNVKEIGRMYDRGDFPDREDSKGAREANEAFEDYIEKSGIVGNTSLSNRRMKLDELTGQIAYENERQGFIKGFRYALNLLIDEKSAQG